MINYFEVSQNAIDRANREHELKEAFGNGYMTGFGIAMFIVLVSAAIGGFFGFIVPRFFA